MEYDKKLQKISDFLEHVEKKLLIQTLTIILADPENEIKILDILKTNKNVVLIPPQASRYEYALCDHQVAPDMIIISYPDKTDLYRHLTLNALDRMKLLNVPIAIITDYLPADFLNKTSPILMFHNIHII